LILDAAGTPLVTEDSKGKEIREGGSREEVRRERIWEKEEEEEGGDVDSS
jgi:hypothetical protein